MIQGCPPYHLCCKVFFIRVIGEKEGSYSKDTIKVIYVYKYIFGVGGNDEEVEVIPPKTGIDNDGFKSICNRFDNTSVIDVKDNSILKILIMMFSILFLKPII